MTDPTGGHWHDDHDPHDHDLLEERIEDNPIWQQDNVELVSVGVDIGSSGTQVAFSRLHLRRRGEDLTSRYVVVRRELLHESQVHFTPFTDDLLIEPTRLGEILDQAYADARLGPEDVDTGVVILTGEALRRRNAELVTSVVSARAGDLVCATAGHHMEAMLAAYGSGTVRRSHDEGSRLLNLDVGGGTTKLALVDHGRVLGTAAVHAGGRLVVVEEGMVIRLEPAGAEHAERGGHPLALGGSVTPQTLDAVANAMADVVSRAVAGEPGRHDLTPSLGVLGDLDGVVVSGGVAEYVYGKESRDFGDLGPALGAALARRFLTGALPGPLLDADQRIRATVLGASEYSVQLSGMTSHISAPERTLPRRSLRVARPTYELTEEIDAGAVGRAIEDHLTVLEIHPEDDVVVALHFEGVPSYRRLRGLADGVRRGLAAAIEQGRPLYLMLDADVARTLGALLGEELGVTNDIVALDGLALRDFDHVDLGRLREPSMTVPVTIKSLVFGTRTEPAELSDERWSG
jgi:ethanolamine utilization protein EutA